MKSGRFSEEQITGVLKRYEAGQKVGDLAITTCVRTAVWDIQRRTSSQHSGSALGPPLPAYRSRNRRSRLPWRRGLDRRTRLQPAT